jgi:predicted ATPase
LSRKQRAKSLELSAVMSLSALWQKQDRRDEAREMLQAVYDGFTEGFDTADLKRANKLLNALP